MLGIVHTSFALVDPRNTLAREMLPDTVEIVNVVDDTLLSYAREHGVDEKLDSSHVHLLSKRSLGGRGRHSQCVLFGGRDRRCRPQADRYTHFEN